MQLLGLSRVRKDAPGRANTALMHAERGRLRTLLRAAAERGAIAHECARLDDFLAVGESMPLLIDLDEELEGDEAHNPIDLEADAP